MLKRLDWKHFAYRQKLYTMTDKPKSPKLEEFKRILEQKKRAKDGIDPDHEDMVEYAETEDERCQRIFDDDACWQNWT